MVHFDSVTSRGTKAETKELSTFPSYTFEPNLNSLNNVYTRNHNTKAAPATTTMLPPTTKRTNTDNKTASIIKEAGEQTANKFYTE